MRTKIFSENSLNVIKGHPRLYRRLRQARELTGGLARPRTLTGVPGRVHANDFMCDGTSEEDAASYATRGREDAETIHRLVLAAGAASSTWLDFGCGYGRVLRWLASGRHPGSMTCYDINWEAARFCGDEFGVNAIRSSASLAEARFGRFEVVYCVSVVTHLADDLAFFSMIAEHVAPGGVLIFTTQGEWSAQKASEYGPFYEPASIAKELAQSGTSWIPYPHGDGTLGMRWHTREYVEQHTPLPLFAFEQRGLGGHHDIFVFRRPR